MIPLPITMVKLRRRQPSEQPPPEPMRGHASRDDPAGRLGHAMPAVQPGSSMVSARVIRCLGLASPWCARRRRRPTAASLLASERIVSHRVCSLTIPMGNSITSCPGGPRLTISSDRESHFNTNALRSRWCRVRRRPVTFPVHQPIRQQHQPEGAVDRPHLGGILG